jgi:hypothetical protein
LYFQQFKIAQGNNQSVFDLVGTWDKVFLHLFQQEMHHTVEEHHWVFYTRGLKSLGIFCWWCFKRDFLQTILVGVKVL